MTESERKKESRNEKFRRLARVRVSKVSEDIRKLGNLSSPNYEYSEEEVARMFEYIQSRLDEAKARFSDDHEEMPEFDF